MRHSLSLHLDKDVTYRVIASGSYVWIEAIVGGSFSTTTLHCHSLASLEALETALGEAKTLLQSQEISPA